MEPGTLAVMIPIVATVLGFGAVFWWIYWNHRKQRLQYEERRLMIEKGMAPPVLSEGEGGRWTPEALRRGPPGADARVRPPPGDGAHRGRRRH